MCYLLLYAPKCNDFILTKLKGKAMKEGLKEMKKKKKKVGIDQIEVNIE